MSFLNRNATVGLIAVVAHLVLASAESAAAPALQSNGTLVSASETESASHPAASASTSAESVSPEKSATTASPTPEEQRAAKKMMQRIQQSHIKANVPPTKKFARFLERDLEKYFSALLKHDVSVEYDLLRDLPTQAGVSYPKYYIWVRVYDQDKLFEEGAARVAAIDKESFDVTHFLSNKSIREDGQNVETIFPKALCPLILEKAFSK